MMHQSALFFLIALAAPAPPAAAQGARPASPVQVEVVEEREIVPTAVLLGTTEPHRRSVVASSIEGYVVGYPVDEGQRVRADDVIARLRDDILRLQLKEVEAALGETRERYENALRDLERARRLVETDSLTARALDTRATEERTLALRLLQGEAQVEVLKADIAKKQVRAPFDGQVVEEHTEVGEWVTRGGPVATLVDISSVYVRANIPERYIRFVDDGQAVSVWVDAAADEPFTATVAAVSNEGDPVSRTFPVRVEVANEDGALRAGMSARVEVPAGRPQRAVVVSKDAILLQGTESYVFVVTAEGIAMRRPVTTGVSSGNRFAVLEGLHAGERVVVRGNERIQPGAPVQVIPSSSGRGTGS